MIWLILEDMRDESWVIDSYCETSSTKSELMLFKFKLDLLREMKKREDSKKV